MGSGDRKEYHRKAYWLRSKPLLYWPLGLLGDVKGGFFVANWGFVRQGRKEGRNEIGRGRLLYTRIPALLEYGLAL